jgi:hypothetical protein
MELFILKMILSSCYFQFCLSIFFATLLSNNFQYFCLSVVLRDSYITLYRDWYFIQGLMTRNYMKFFMHREKATLWTEMVVACLKVLLRHYRGGYLYLH